MSCLGLKKPHERKAGNREWSETGFRGETALSQTGVLQGVRPDWLKQYHDFCHEIHVINILPLSHLILEPFHLRQTQ